MARSPAGKSRAGTQACGGRAGTTTGASLFGRTSRRLRLLLAALFGLLLCAPPAALAQTASPAEAAAATPQPGVFRLVDLGYNDDTLRGRGFTSDYFLPGPGEYPLAPSGSTLELVFSGTSLAGPDSSMSVSWNGVPVADIPLAHKEDRQRVTIPLPTDRIDPVTNRLVVTGSLDLQENVCREDSPANHVTIFRDTGVHYALADDKPHPTPIAPDLARYPSPFISSVPGAVSSVTLMLPEKPSSDILRATAAVASSLGRAAGSRPLSVKVATGVKSAAEAGQANAIFIGAVQDLPALATVPNLPIQIAGGQITRDGTAVGQDDGVLAEAPSPVNPGRMILAITAQSEAGVVKAASVLSATRTARLLGGSSAVVDQLQAQAAIASGQTPSGRRVVSLSDLGRTDETLNGIGDHSVTFKVELPGVPQGSSGLALNLVTSHSPLLDTGNSSVRVTVNNVPLDSIGLKGKNQTRDVTQLKLPATALRSGVNTFDVTFTLRLAVPQTTSVCQALPSEQAWAVLHASTSVDLPTQFGSSAEADLAGYPYPFVASAGLEKTAFVVPDQFDLDPFVRYCADLGRSLAEDTMPPRVVSAADFQGTGPDANLVVWGTPAQNPVLAQLGDYLPLAITPGASQRYAFASNLQLSVRDSSNLGVIQELPSPWHEGRRILVLSGTAADAIPLAVTALSQPGLADNLALVSKAPPQSATVVTPLGSPPAVQVTTYKIKAAKQVVQQRSTIEMLPVILAAALGLLALLMATSMAYQAFVREPRNRR